MSDQAEKRPWLNNYRLGPYKLAQSLEPYPEKPLFSLLDDAADRHPGAAAVDYCGLRLNYRAVRSAVDSLAAALVSLGVEKGDRVATVLPTSPQYVIANFAILKTGAVHVPCSVLHRARELEYEFGQAGVETVICLLEQLDRVEAAQKKTKVRRVIVTGLNDYTPAQSDRGEAPAGTHAFRALIETHAPVAPQVDLKPREDLAYLAFTGGATGVPRGVMLTHFNRYSNVLQSMAWAMSSLEKSIRGKASVCIGVPLFHAYGDSAALFAVHWGLRMILVRDPRDIDYIARAIVENRPFLTVLVPTQLMRLREKNLPRLPIQIISGAAPLPAEVREGIEAKIKMPVSEGYGLTETSPTTHLDLTGFSKITGFAARQKYSIGIPVPDTDIRLVDTTTGRESLPGEPGHMFIRGPQVMKGYWPLEGAGLEDGWLPTGDIARMDEDGYFYLVDRIKDMVNISGYKVYTGQIDDILHRHPAVQMAAAIGIPDPDRPGSERIKVFIVPREECRDTISGEEIIAFCRERCAPYAVPRLVEFRDRLPLTVTEKIFKRRLREEEARKASPGQPLQPGG